MFTLHSDVLEYLAACEQRGANAEGTCRSTVWARERFTSGETLGEALTVLEEHDTAQDISMFSFSAMLPVIDTFTRRRFGKVISLNSPHAVQAWAWRRLIQEGIAPTPVEDELLRGQWHSKWQGASKLPGWEVDP